MHPGTEQARQHRAHCARFSRCSRRRPAARCAGAGGTERPKVPRVARGPLGRVGISGGQRRLVGINVTCQRAAQRRARARVRVNHGLRVLRARARSRRHRPQVKRHPECAARRVRHFLVARLQYRAQAFHWQCGQRAWAIGARNGSMALD